MTTEIYSRIFKKLEEIFKMPLKELFEKYGFLKLQAPGFMDLNVDVLSKNRLSLAHNYIQNGDVMADPDMEIEVNFDRQTAEVLSYQDCYGYQTVYVFNEKGEKVLFYPKTKKDLNIFISQWLTNIKNQGHIVIEMKGKVA
jgi:uncharacterized protein YqiB (DUF1249 family)